MSDEVQRTEQVSEMFNETNAADESFQQKIGGGEGKKLFVGGLGYDVTDDMLREHFSKYGEVLSADVKMDRFTGRTRGFGFVEFTTAESCRKALDVPQHIFTGSNSPAEVKMARSRANKKVFVGGLTVDTTEIELRSYFEQFGIVEEIQWPIMRGTQTKRSFAFIAFENEESANRAVEQATHTFHGKSCDIKKAFPPTPRFSQRGGAPFMYDRQFAGGYHPQYFTHPPYGVPNVFGHMYN